ncbi:LamG-like jellyroll fold domain-containing protein [Actinoplanes italicus]|uniref:Carboxypeptidase family protein n=1 Tax=Actinoplanes italicus TaxID=113567 RepID=A0A2T0JLC6_9ACTN|nr:LamG-like jellyroll fold domain-containing protein [Actinoplanes italicus]PRX08404.1 carboxypeptidase family protein [Actinoplanes italicus]
MHHRLRFAMSFFVSALLTVTSSLVTATEAAAEPSRSPERCPAGVEGEAAAARAAVACRGRVEVTSLGDERTQVFATGDGSFVSETSAVVRRVRSAAGKWVKPDPILEADDEGRLVPAAAALDISFSGGGSGPAITVGRGESRLSLTWLNKLPAPRVSGASATYAEVYPGVDLVLTAEAEGFTEMLVVKTPTAAANPALTSVRFKMATRKLKLRKGASGDLSAVTDSGVRLFGSGTPMMWDSSKPADDSRADGPSLASRLAVPGQRSKVMPLALNKGHLVIHPDTTMLRSKAMKFPVYIDPGISASTWTMINSAYPSQSYWSYDRRDCPAPHTAVPCAKVGYTTTPKAMIYRSLFSFNISTLLDKHIQKAVLSMDTVYSYSNTDYGTQARVVTGGINSGTTWTNSVDKWGGVAATALSHAYDRKRYHTEWGVVGAVTTASKGDATVLTFGLRAVSESNVYHWKKFDASTAVLSVTYNSYPNAPQWVDVGEKTCARGTSRPYIRTTTPKLRAKLTDPDGTSRLLKGTFYWRKYGVAQNDNDKIAQGSVTPGQTAVVTIPSGRLADGSTYVVDAVANDGIDNGQRSVTCEFIVDATPPPAPGGASSTAYPNNGQANGGVGTEGTFRVLPPATIPTDLDGYAWTVDPGVSAAAANQITANATSREGEFKFTPAVDRKYNLRVWTRDKAGNHSAVPFEYEFIVRAGTGPDARWTFDEQDGKDVSEHGNTVTVDGGSWTPGRGGWGKALLADGTSTTAVTAGPITTNDPQTGDPISLHSNGNFTVAATVRLDSTEGSGQRVIMAQDGDRTSPFLLSYSVADKKWRFAVAATDADAPVTAAVLSNATATTGVWTRLLATYDGTTRVLRLYVNGALQTATATAAAAFDATGPVTIGRGRQAGVPANFFAGAIDDVRIYGRVVVGTEGEFTLLQRPNPPLVTFPAGASAYVGRTLTAVVSAGGDTTVTRVRYQVGANGEAKVETLSAAGGQKTLTLPVTSAGTPHLILTSLDSGNLESAAHGSVLTFTEPPKLSGRVVDAITDAALSGVPVRLRPGDRIQNTNANGEYAFTGLDPGDYTLSVAYAGSGCAAMTATTEVAVTGDEVRNLRIAPESDTYGYVCRVKTSTPFVAGTTKLALSGYKAAVQVPNLPFAVPYYGKTYQSLWVSVDGFLSFVNPSSRYYEVGVSLPDRRNAPWAAVAPFLSSLDVDAQASVWTSVTGTGAGQRFVVEWRNVLIRGTTSRLTFEAILAPNGDITFNYSGLSGDLPKGAGATVGITSPGGNYAMQYSFQEPVLASGAAVTFIHPAESVANLVGSISGMVVDPTGEAREGVRVWMDGSYSAVTDGTGYFRIDGVENGTYQIGANVGCFELDDQLATVDGDSWHEGVLRGATDSFGNWCEVTEEAWMAADNELQFALNGEINTSLPFPVRFFNNSFTAATVDRWGTLIFQGGSIPNAGGRVYMWPGAPQAVDEKTKVYTGVVGVSPNRRYVLEWRDLTVRDSPDLRFDLQLVIGEDSSITVGSRNLPSGRDAEIYFYGGGSSYIELIYYEDGRGLRAGKTVTFRPPAAA